MSHLLLSAVLEYPFRKSEPVAAAASVMTAASEVAAASGTASAAA
jgi:hypothetical protein